MLWDRSRLNNCVWVADWRSLGHQVTPPHQTANGYIKDVRGYGTPSIAYCPAMFIHKSLLVVSLLSTLGLAASPLANTIVQGIGAVTNMSSNLRTTTDGINVFNVFFRGHWKSRKALPTSPRPSRV